MLVMIVVADVVARVMQQRRVAQRVAILRSTANSCTECVEELHRELLHMARMRLLVLGALGELLHAAPAPFTRIGGLR